MLFYALSLCIALPIFAFMILISPVVFLVDRHRRDVYGRLNTFWATMSTRLFFGVDVQGRENLPPEDEAVVFVANHASYLVRLRARPCAPRRRCGPGGATATFPRRLTRRAHRPRTPRTSTRCTTCTGRSSTSRS